LGHEKNGGRKKKPWMDMRVEAKDLAKALFPAKIPFISGLAFVGTCVPPPPA